MEEQLSEMKQEEQITAGAGAEPEPAPMPADGPGLQPAPAQEKAETSAPPEKPEGNAVPSIAAPRQLGTKGMFWLLALYGLPGIGLLFSALPAFFIRRAGAHRSLARACFAWQIVGLAVLGGLTAAYFFLRSRYALGNFLERSLQYLLDFVRANADKL